LFDNEHRRSEFWTDRLGFELRCNQTYGGERWVEVCPLDGAPPLVLSARSADEPKRP
jgi:hypothetical protein